MTPEEIEQARIDAEKEANKEKTHSDKAFRQVSDDMHKYKGALKDQEAENIKLRQRLDDIERSNLEQKEQFKDLYEAERSRNDELEKSMDEKNIKFLNSQKLSAVKEKLGQFKKPEYNKFIDTNKIVVDTDGQIDMSTVEREVDRLKKEYPELIKVKASSTMPSEQPESGDTQTKSVTIKTKDDRMNARRELIEQRSKQS